MKLSLFILIFIAHSAFSQDLLKERIRKLTDKKTSIYVESGIFHNGRSGEAGVLKGIRSSYTAKQGFERIVLDFSGSKLPRIYGHLQAEEKKLNIDFFETNLDKELTTVSSTKYVEKVNLYPIEANYLSMEIKLKTKVSADVFYLENPARIVIDLKN